MDSNAQNQVFLGSPNYLFLCQSYLAFEGDSPERFLGGPMKSIVRFYPDIPKSMAPWRWPIEKQSGTLPL